ELAVRLPSAIFGILTVGLSFFFVKQVFNNKKIALLSMALLAISPWHIHLSRVESESNTAVFLVLLAVMLFIRAVKKSSWLFIPSFVFFALTYFTYAGNYVFTTLLVLGIVIIYRKQIFKNRYFIVGVILFILIALFISSKTIFANNTKISGIGIFGDPALVHAKIEIPRNEHINTNSLEAKFFHNRLIFASEKFAQNYLKSFSPEFLFIKGGDNGAHNILNFGNMYLIEAPFLLLGLFYLIFFKKGSEKKLILYWLLIAPISASITKDAPHTNRMFAIFPVLPILTALGLYYLITLVKKKAFRNILIASLIIVFVINIGMYIDRYYVHFPKNEIENWGFSYRKINDFINQKKYVSKKIVMSKPETSPYIFLLFYSKYDPVSYQKNASRYGYTEDGFVHVKGFDRYEFRGIDWDKDLNTNTLVIDFASEIPDSIKNERYSISQISESGRPIFSVVETK
ncbi:MAG: glycosyltransferase family 39 protein, partial [Patescibacteria group bacterium]|nr:glycosyltransferase family 39 protein [Patescibacteria group bacterium]